METSRHCQACNEGKLSIVCFVEYTRKLSSHFKHRSDGICVRGRKPVRTVWSSTANKMKPQLVCGCHDTVNIEYRDPHFITV